MRIPLIAGNWKMNTTVDEATRLVEAMRPGLDKITNVGKVVCPPFISLAAVRELLKGTSIRLGAQNLYFEEKGAYTGEISPLMLAGLCDYVIVGHSERRQHFFETDEVINKKLKAAFKVRLNPILCIGERLEEYEAGKTEEVVRRQLLASSERVFYLSGLVVAYEPIWAIGTGRAATGKQANDTICFIRGIIAEMCGKAASQDTLLLYGGSVTAENIAEFMQQPDIDGALVGGASLKADQFVSIVRQTRDVKSA